MANPIYGLPLAAMLGAASGAASGQVERARLAQSQGQQSANRASREKLSLRELAFRASEAKQNRELRRELATQQSDLALQSLTSRESESALTRDFQAGQLDTRLAASRDLTTQNQNFQASQFDARAGLQTDLLDQRLEHAGSEAELNRAFQGEQNDARLGLQETAHASQAVDRHRRFKLDVARLALQKKQLNQRGQGGLNPTGRAALAKDQNEADIASRNFIASNDPQDFTALMHAARTVAARGGRTPEEQEAIMSGIINQALGERSDFSDFQASPSRFERDSLDNAATSMGPFGSPLIALNRLRKTYSGVSDFDARFGKRVDKLEAAIISFKESGREAPPQLLKEFRDLQEQKAAILARGQNFKLADFLPTFK